MYLTIRQLKMLSESALLQESRHRDVWRKYVPEDLEDRWNAADWDTGEGTPADPDNPLFTREEDAHIRKVSRALSKLSEDSGFFPIHLTADDPIEDPTTEAEMLENEWFWENHNGQIAPNSRNKYLEWMMHQHLTRNEPDRELIKTCAEFEKFRHIEPRDIWQYKTLGELRAAIENSRAKKQRKEELKVSSSEFDKVYEDDSALVIHPKTKHAAQKYGMGTRWCISATKSHNYFDEYDERGAKHYFIIRKNPEGDEWDKASVTMDISLGSCPECNQDYTAHEIANFACSNCNRWIDEHVERKVFYLFNAYDDSVVEGFLPKELHPALSYIKELLGITHYIGRDDLI